MVTLEALIVEQTRLTVLLARLKLADGSGDRARLLSEIETQADYCERLCNHSAASARLFK